MKIKLTLCLLVGLLFPVELFANCAKNSCVNEYVERIYPNSNGVVYIGTSGDETKLDCEPVSGVYTTLLLSESGGNAIYSTLLAAQLANKKVMVRIENGSSNCKIKYIVIDKG